MVWTERSWSWARSTRAGLGGVGSGGVGSGAVGRMTVSLMGGAVCSGSCVGVEMSTGAEIGVVRVGRMVALLMGSVAVEMAGATGSLNFWMAAPVLLMELALSMAAFICWTAA